MYNDITGIILSGGKSKRMGVNKSLLKVGNKAIIEIVQDKISKLFKELLVITNEPELYQFLNLEIYKDIFQGKGPLAGIHSGLVHSKTQKSFIISCDMPLITVDMINTIINYKKDSSITIAKDDGYIQQLCGVYDKCCIPEAGKLLEESLGDENRNTQQEKRGCKVLQLIKEVGAEILDAEALPSYDKDLFFNMNTMDDFTYVKKKLLNVGID